MNVVKQKLIEARKVIENPASWHKGSYARDTYGLRVPVYSDNAVSYCTIGACNKVFNSWSTTYQEVLTRLQRAANVPPGEGIPDWNDAPERTHEEVLAAFDKAIEECPE